MKLGKLFASKLLRAFLMVFVILGVVVMGVFMVKKKQFEPPPPFAFPPEIVTSYVATEMVWEESVSAVGTLRASQGAIISAEVPGTISVIHFESGQNVEKGDLLFELDTSAEEAELASAKATLNLARLNLKRAQDLRQSRAISQSELDTVVAQASEAEAEMLRITANLEKKVITAPFAGRLGIRQVDVGEYLNPGTAVVSLQSMDPIYVDFSLPQQQVSKVADGYKARLDVDTYPDLEFEGKIEAIDPDLDETNRMFRVRAVLENEGGLLRPGMFANVEVVQPEPSAVVAVPSTSVYYQAYGNTIFVVKNQDEQSVVEQRFVTLGRTIGDFVAILEGVQAGEEVVTSGVFKLSNGRSVAVDNSKAFEVSMNPQPEDA